jgi:sterol desaturase/sphingolipid hydroxylase (fatty acid hydroxylase superfamily)
MSITDTIYKGVKSISMNGNPRPYDFFLAFSVLFLMIAISTWIVILLAMLLVLLWPVSFIGLAILVAIIALFFYTYITHKE